MMDGERCVLCGGALSGVIAPVWDTRFGVPKPYRIERCAQCTLEQTRPKPSGPELGQLYAQHYNFGGEKNTTYTDLRARFLMSPIYRLLMAIDGDISFHARAGRGRLIDIGCNEGRGLPLYRRNGFDEVEGLETNPVAAAQARGRGFAIHEVDVADFHPNEKFDVAVLSNVLEHALDPVAMLVEVKRILKPGGEVWISCPNAASWARHLFGRGWINWHVPFHIVHFTDATLVDCARRAGFVPVAREQITPALWVAHSVIATLSAKPGQPTSALRKPLIVMALMALARGLGFPLLWLGNRVGHGDCLKLVARAS